jgi:hypothetical protein
MKKRPPTPNSGGFDLGEVVFFLGPAPQDWGLGVGGLGCPPKAVKSKAQNFT